MNSLERVFEAVRFKPVDRTPVAPFIMSFAARYARVPYSEYCSNYKKMAAAQFEVVKEFEVDMVTPDTDPYREAEGCGAIIDYPYDDQPVEKKPALKDKDTLFKLSVNSVLESKRVIDKVRGVEELKKRTGGEIPVLGWVESPFQNAAILRGLDRFMLDLYDDTEFIRQLLVFTTRLAIEYAGEQIRAGAHIIGIGDAIASMISRDCFAENADPHVKEVVSAVQEAGAYAKYHICGNADHLLSEIKELGADIVNIDQKVDLQKARLVLEKTCIKGNLDPAGLLLNGTPAEIMKEAEKCLLIGGDGYILSPGCELPRDTPAENLKALIKAADERR